VSRQRRADDSPQDWAARWREVYASAPRLSRRIWAWQFLRRNPRYRADWLGALERAKADPALIEGPPFRYRSEVIHHLGPPPAFNLLGGRVYPRLPVETIYDLRGREDWGLVCGYHDPDCSWPSELRFLRSFGVLTTAEAILVDRVNLAPEVRDWNVLATFDLSRDLAAQLQRVGSLLRHRQGAGAGGAKLAGAPRPKKHLWRFFLFLLDATAEGATPRGLVDAIGKDPIKPARDLDEGLIGERLEAAKLRLEPRGPNGYLAIAEFDDDSSV